MGGSTNHEESSPQENDRLQRLVRLAKLEQQTMDTTTFPLLTVTKLNLSDCDLYELPNGFEDAFPNLSILFLSNNHFEQMPPVIGLLRQLQMVAFKSNNMTSIHPDALQSQLRWLILTNNKLVSLPDTIGRCVKLQKCMLAGNQLTHLPDTMKHCQNLELIRLAHNQLSKPPWVVLELPKLAWIALADNPFLSRLDKTQDLPVLSLDNTSQQQQELLGQGAGGSVYRMNYQGQPVAVKSFHATVTSDGLADSERCIAAATAKCPGLVQVLGQTADNSLVLEYLQEAQPLAGPPSLESCSRDVYPHDLTLTRRQALQTITVVLQALASMHQLGICHGDVYAHNILMAKVGIRLSDLGAAFFYDSDLKSQLQRIELRAVAILVQEINDLMMESGDQELLTKLIQTCQKDNATLESVYIWWQQEQLSCMAAAFEAGLDDPQEEKN